MNNRNVLIFLGNQLLKQECIFHWSRSRRQRGNRGKFDIACRPVVSGCAGCAMAHPDFGRSINPIATRGDRLCPPYYYWHTRIFRPSDGPEYVCTMPSFLSWLFYAFGWLCSRLVRMAIHYLRPLCE